MPPPALVVVVGSAGGVEALKRLASALPAGLPATVVMGLHLPAAARSYLPEILGRVARLPVVEATEHLTLEPGRIVTTRPDAHCVVLDGHITLGFGGRENGSRPSHDVLLRSAAVARGASVVGVVLTGLLDDGAAGLAAVRRYGGACLVQDPDDAEFASMPRAALAAVPSARAVPLDRLAEAVVAAVLSPPAPPDPVSPVLQQQDLAEIRSAIGGPPAMNDGHPVGEPSPYGCLDCHGVLNRVGDADVLRFRCRTGHAWTAESLVARQDDDVEDALWTALRVLEERAEMSRRLADSAVVGNREWSQEHFRRRSAEADRSAELIRSVLRRESDLPSLPQVSAEP